MTHCEKGLRTRLSSRAPHAGSFTLSAAELRDIVDPLRVQQILHVDVGGRCTPGPQHFSGI